MVPKIVPYSEEISFLVFNSTNKRINMRRITFEFAKLPKIKFETHLRKIKGKSIFLIIIIFFLLFLLFWRTSMVSKKSISVAFKRRSTNVKMCILVKKKKKTFW